MVIATQYLGIGMWPARAVGIGAMALMLWFVFIKLPNVVACALCRKLPALQPFIQVAYYGIAGLLLATFSVFLIGQPLLGSLFYVVAALPLIVFTLYEAKLIKEKQAIWIMRGLIGFTALGLTTVMSAATQNDGLTGVPTGMHLDRSVAGARTIAAMGDCWLKYDPLDEDDSPEEACAYNACLQQGLQPDLCREMAYESNTVRRSATAADATTDAHQNGGE